MSDNECATIRRRADGSIDCRYYERRARVLRGRRFLRALRSLWMRRPRARLAGAGAAGSPA